MRDEQGVRPNLARPAANADEHSYLLSVEEAADAAAGHSRTIYVDSFSEHGKRL